MPGRFDLRSTELTHLRKLLRLGPTPESLARFAPFGKDSDVVLFPSDVRETAPGDED